MHLTLLLEFTQGCFVRQYLAFYIEVQKQTQHQCITTMAWLCINSGEQMLLVHNQSYEFLLQFLAPSANKILVNNEEWWNWWQFELSTLLFSPFFRVKSINKCQQEYSFYSLYQLHQISDRCCRHECDIYQQIHNWVLLLESIRKKKKNTLVRHLKGKSAIHLLPKRN